MATNVDSFPITVAMLAYAYAKPATVFTTAAGEANTSDPYLPKTLAAKAGSRGAGTAVTSDPNDVFARTMKAGLERTAYVTGLPNDVTSSDIITVVETTPTISVPTVV